MNIVKTVRNNWKKSLALVGVGALAFKYVEKKYRLVILMHSFHILPHRLHQKY